MLHLQHVAKYVLLRKAIFRYNFLEMQSLFLLNRSLENKFKVWKVKCKLQMTRHVHVHLHAFFSPFSLNYSKSYFFWKFWLLCQQKINRKVGAYLKSGFRVLFVQDNRCSTILVYCCFLQLPLGKLSDGVGQPFSEIECK